VVNLADSISTSPRRASSITSAACFLSRNFNFSSFNNASSLILLSNLSPFNKLDLASVSKADATFTALGSGVLPLPAGSSTLASSALTASNDHFSNRQFSCLDQRVSVASETPSSSDISITDFPSLV